MVEKLLTLRYIRLSHQVLFSTFCSEQLLNGIASSWNSQNMYQVSKSYPTWNLIRLKLYYIYVLAAHLSNFDGKRNLFCSPEKKQQQE